MESRTRARLTLLRKQAIVIPSEQLGTRQAGERGGGAAAALKDDGRSHEGTESRCRQPGGVGGRAPSCTQSPGNTASTGKTLADCWRWMLGPQFLPPACRVGAPSTDSYPTEQPWRAELLDRGPSGEGGRSPGRPEDCKAERHVGGLSPAIYQPRHRDMETWGGAPSRLGSTPPGQPHLDWTTDWGGPSPCLGKTSKVQAVPGSPRKLPNTDGVGWRLVWQSAGSWGLLAGAGGSHGATGDGA